MDTLQPSTDTDQLDIFGALAEIEAAARPVDDRTTEILTTIAGDDLHAEDRRRIVEAILAVAREANGAVDPNAVRTRLTNEHGLTVYPRVVGAVYQALTKRRVLAAVGWTTNLDRAGRNYGRPARTYRLVDWTASAGAA